MPRMYRNESSASHLLSCNGRLKPQELLRVMKWLHGATQSQDCTLYSRILAQWSELLPIRCCCHHADLHREALPLLGGSTALHLKCLELQQG